MTESTSNSGLVHASTLLYIRAAMGGGGESEKEYGETTKERLPKIRMVRQIAKKLDR